LRKPEKRQVTTKGTKEIQKQLQKVASVLKKHVLSAHLLILSLRSKPLDATREKSRIICSSAQVLEKKVRFPSRMRIFI